ncbi:MAG: hypothetical protein NTX72_05560 [Candidatus Uhrbacteria bacterium]|nr:hypothetical protein [Candidatus Uhrbacteria bacterium]
MTTRILLCLVCLLCFGCAAKDTTLKTQASDARLTGIVTNATNSYYDVPCRVSVEGRQKTTFILTVKRNSPAYETCQALKEDMVISIVERDHRLYWNPGNTLVAFD